jgi:hypothetical protein
MPPTTSSRSHKLTLRPHAGQLSILQARQPFVGAIAGTGGGKTVGGMAWLAMNMARRPGELWLAVEPTLDMINRILLRPAKGRWSLLQLLKAFDPHAFLVKSENAIYSTLGTIFLASATNPEGMEGAHVAGVWLDEAGQMSKLAYETAVRRVSFKNGQVLLTTTPYNRGWLFQDFFKRWAAGDQDYHVARFSSLANPQYPKEAYERNKRSMSPERFRMFHEGSFERPEGMILTNWEDRHLVDPFPIPEQWWKGAAIDFGWNHPFAGVWAARNPDGVYYLYQEYRKSQRQIADHHRELLRLSAGAGKPQIWYADPAGKEERLELARLGLATTMADNDVLTGLDTLQTLLATDRLKVFKTCALWQEEVEGYQWDTSAGIFIDKPKKIDDDLMDATRYLLQTAEKRAGLKLHT